MLHAAMAWYSLNGRTTQPNQQQQIQAATAAIPALPQPPVQQAIPYVPATQGN